MMWPTESDFRRATSEPEKSFSLSELQSSQICDDAGRPSVISGEHACVIALQVGKRKKAVRCFLSSWENLSQRCEAISATLLKLNLACTVPFSYIEQGIRVNDIWYPISVMDWFDENTLFEFVINNMHQPDRFAGLSDAWLRMSQSLRAAGIAHGSLDPTNVFLINGQLKLIDYDAAYIPSLETVGSPYSGSSGYRHPRFSDVYGPHSDNFADWVIYTTLTALECAPELFKRDEIRKDGLLFKERDFLEPAESKIFKALANHGNNRLNRVADVLQQICLFDNLAAVPTLTHVEGASNKTLRSWKDQEINADVLLYDHNGKPLIYKTSNTRLSAENSSASAQRKIAPYLMAGLLGLVTVIGAAVFLTFGFSGSQTPAVTRATGTRDVRILNDSNPAEKTTERMGTQYALFIANKTYDDKRIPELANPIKDAEAIAAELHDNYGWTVEILRNPAEREIITKLQKYASKFYKGNDQLFVYIAAHGDWDASTRAGFLLARDAQKGDAEHIQGFVPFSRLQELLNKSNCRHVVVALDACFGGGFLDSIALGSTRSVSGLNKAIPLGELLKRTTPLMTRKLLASGALEPVFDGAPEGHSPFATHILEALRTWGGSAGFLRFLDIAKPVIETRPFGLAERFGQDEAGSDFFFIPTRFYTDADSSKKPK